MNMQGHLPSHFWRGRFKAFGAVVFFAAAICGFSSASASSSVAEKFHTAIQPILSQYCYDCHGEGMSKGKLAFDELSDEDLTNRRDLWVAVLKNVRAGLMPPAKKPRPNPEDM